MTDQTPLSGFPENLAQNAPPIKRKRSYGDLPRAAVVAIAPRDLLAFDNDRSNRVRAHSLTLFSPSDRSISAGLRGA